MKIEMQIEDGLGRKIPQLMTNKASEQVVQEIYMCPTLSDEEVGEEKPEAYRSGLFE